MLNREYMPKWKIDLEEALEENRKKVTKEITKEIIISAIEFMKNEGLSEASIRKYAKQEKVSMKVVDEILNSSQEKPIV